MQILVIGIIAISLALCVFGFIEQRGAMLVMLDGRVILMALIFGAVLLAASGAGYGLGQWILSEDLGDHERFWIHVLSGILLAGTGIRFFSLALRRVSLLEHRMENVDMRHDTLLCLRFCFMELMAGVVCGLLQVSLPGFLTAIFCTNLLATAGGYAFGRANGAVLGRQCWLVSGALMWGLGIILQLA